jgi:hypothetical protein
MLRMNIISSARHRGAKQAVLSVADPAIEPVRRPGMKRILASVAALGLIAAPAMAATTTSKTPTTASKDSKAAAKASKKAAKQAAKAASKTAPKKGK